MKIGIQAHIAVSKSKFQTIDNGLYMNCGRQLIAYMRCNALPYSLLWQM